MDSDERNDIGRQYGSMSMEQTLTAPLNNTIDFLGPGNEYGQTTVSYEEILDETSRELLKFGFKKIAKKNDYIRIESIGDAFRHSGQNPSEDTVKDMIEKAKSLKETHQQEVDPDEKADDRLSFADFLTIVHEFYVTTDDDKQQLQEAFDILDPENKSKLMVDNFTYLLKNCDWPEDDIDLLLSQLSCADGYFIIDDLQKMLNTPVELPKKKAKKGGKAKKKGK
ncbi:unnamed protein product [Adineta ricciae]|uniref:EF-hand domain-containing protein n=1 Tax=Adineta ricciae TaxID=249248 RepID=A0A816G9G8_ADIRI|nr:unnamed protein product [Adineta ricciae]CAF1670823.1 unnamed protein product [Adineta ricciae]